MASLLPLALAEGGLTDINLGLTIWTVVLFLIFATVMKKLAWGPLLGAIEEREKSVRDSLEGASKARDEAAALLEQHRTLMRDAGREREEIVKRALAESETLKADLAAKARTESEQMVSRARDQIEREKNVTPSMRPAATIMAPRMSPAALGWRAMPSMAEAASLPMPAAPPMMVRPAPMPAAKYASPLGSVGIVCQLLS